MLGFKRSGFSGRKRRAAAFDDVVDRRMRGNGGPHPHCADRAKQATQKKNQHSPAPSPFSIRNGRCTIVIMQDCGGNPRHQRSLRHSAHGLRLKMPPSRRQDRDWRRLFRRFALSRPAMNSFWSPNAAFGDQTPPFDGRSSGGGAQSRRTVKHPTTRAQALRLRPRWLLSGGGHDR